MNRKAGFLVLLSSLFLFSDSLLLSRFSSHPSFPLRFRFPETLRTNPQGSEGQEGFDRPVAPVAPDRSERVPVRRDEGPVPDFAEFHQAHRFSFSL